MSNSLGTLSRGRLRIPLSRLRRALTRAPIAISLEAAGQRLRVHGVAEALRAPITFSTDIEIGGLEAHGRARLLTLRFFDTTAQVPDDAPGPLAATLRAGSIDLSRVGDRVGAQLGLPDFIVSARGNAIVLDLMLLPALTRPEKAAIARATAVATSALTISRVQVVDDALELQLALLPVGASGLARSGVGELLLPSLSRWVEGGAS